MANLDLTHVTIDETGPWISWNARLMIDDIWIADVTGDANTPFKITNRAPGISSDQLTELDHEVSLSMPLRDVDGSSQPQTIASLCIDLVSFEWISRNLADRLRKEAVGIIPGKVTAMASVRVPEGGSLAEARSHLLTAEPKAIILNDLELDEATIRYIDASISA